MTDAYTPPPSPAAHLAHSQRDRTRNRCAASPRLKIHRRPLSERPSTPTQRSSSPELIFSMSPIDSHFPPSAPAPTPKTQLNPGALLARARQQSASAFAALANRPRPRTPLLYSFPKTAMHLRAPPTTGTTRAESRPACLRCSPITESSDDAAHSPEATRSTHTRPTPIAVPLPIPAKQHHRSFDSAQYSHGSFYGSSDAEVDDIAHAVVPPRKIVGFDTGTDSEADSPSTSADASPFRLERFVTEKGLSLDSHDGAQDSVRRLTSK